MANWNRNPSRKSPGNGRKTLTREQRASKKLTESVNLMRVTGLAKSIP